MKNEPSDELRRAEAIGNALTDKELEKGYLIYEQIGKEFPGFTFLSHLKKIPLNNGRDEYVYEYELSEAFVRLMTELNKVYSPPSLATAVALRIISELLPNR